MLKDGEGGVDGLLGACNITVSSDGNYAYVAGRNDNALSWYARNTSTGALAYEGVLKDGEGGFADGLNYPQDITLSSDGNHAYVVATGDDSVSWYDRNSSTGILTYSGMLRDEAEGSEYLDGVKSISVSPNGNYAYTASYVDDTVSWFERNASNGSLALKGFLRDGVDGIDGLQFANAVIVSGDGSHAYVAGLADDAVSWFEIDASNGALTYGGMLEDGVNGVDGLKGPNNLTLSPDGSHVYVVSRYDDALSWFERNASTGALTYGGVLKDGENGVDGLDYPRSVVISADGKNAYVAGFDDDAVSWYVRNASTGALTYMGMLKDGVGGSGRVGWSLLHHTFGGWKSCVCNGSY